MIGQYLAEVAGLGPLAHPAHIRKTLESIYRYNYKRTLVDHDSVERTYVLNDEAALVICDYGKAERPRIPFPYYAEVMTGLEYFAAAHMLYAGMTREGVDCIADIRARYDGERATRGTSPSAATTTPAPCPPGARSSRSAASATTALTPPSPPSRPSTRKPSAPSGPPPPPGEPSLIPDSAGAPAAFRLHILAGSLNCRTCAIQAPAGKSSAHVGAREIHHQMERQRDTAAFSFPEVLTLSKGDELRLEVRA